MDSFFIPTGNKNVVKTDRFAIRRDLRPEVIDWLRETFGPAYDRDFGFRYGYEPFEYYDPNKKIYSSGMLVKFHRTRDATMFKLAWLGAI